MAIPCPKCGKGTDTRTTRTLPNGTVRRRRVCPGVACGTRVSTIEIPLATGERMAGNPAIVSMDDLIGQLRFLATPLLRTLSPQEILAALVTTESVLPVDESPDDPD